MKVNQSPKTTTCLFFFFLISYCISLSMANRAADSSGYSKSVLPLLAAFLITALIIFAVRTTIVAWITVVVLLAFSGKRRRVLAQKGNQITWEVALCLAKVVIKDRSLLAFICTTVITFTTMAWL